MTDRTELHETTAAYRPGQVVDGYVLTEDGTWLPVRTTDGYWFRFQHRFRWALLVALVVFALVWLPVPGLSAVNLGLWPRTWDVAMSWASDWSYWLQLAVLVVEAFVLIAVPVGLIAAAFPSRSKR